MTATDSREGRPHAYVQQGAFTEGYLGKELILSRLEGVFAEGYLGKELLQGKPGPTGGLARVGKSISD